MAEAEREFRRALEFDPQAGYAHDNLGSLMLQREKWIDSLKEFVRAVEVENDNPETWLNLGCFLNSYSFDAAIEALREACTRDPGSPDAHWNLARAYCNIQQFLPAKEAYLRAIDLNPTVVELRHELGQLLMDLGQFADAIRTLKDVIHREPGHTEAFVDLGIALLTKGFWDEAENALQQALKQKADHFAAIYHLAAIRCLKGQIAAGLELLEQASRIDPELVNHWAPYDRSFFGILEEPRFKAIIDSSIPSACSEKEGTHD